jgi:hypothetical protein
MLIVTCLCILTWMRSLRLNADPLQALVRNRIPAGFDMNVNILTSGYWPSYPIIDAKMPAELSDYQQARC